MDGGGNLLFNLLQAVFFNGVLIVHLSPPLASEETHASQITFLLSDLMLLFISRDDTC